MRDCAIRRLLACGLALVLPGCASPHPAGAPPPTTGLSLPTAATEQAARAVLAEHGIVTAGLGVIVDGELAWSLYHGESSPGIAADARTRFNVASIMKTVATETALRLAAAGELDLDAPLARDWIDPDLAGDPRLRQLTARHVLTHTTGFPNWRFFRRDGRLAFAQAPGTTYGYSGEGFEYLARALARHHRRPYAELVRERVLIPAGLHDAVVTVVDPPPSRVALPVGADGAALTPWCRPGGWCRKAGETPAADDLLVTVADYARFLAWVLRDESQRENDPITARSQVRVDTADDPVVDCTDASLQRCPLAQGYGLGYRTLVYPDHRVIGHGGADWHEVSLAYGRLPTRDGVIVFLNAPNARALAAMPRLLELLDPQSPFPGQYRRWLARAR